MLLFDPATLGTSNNSITFNDDDLDPYYSLDDEKVVGRDIVAYDIKIPEGMGVADYQTLIGKTNYVLSGVMYPGDEVAYTNGIKALRSVASVQIEQDDNDTDFGYGELTWTEEDGYNKQLQLKVLYVNVPKMRKNGLKQPFQLLCKVKYPIIESQTALSTTIGDVNATTSGSSTLSWALPKVIGKTTYSSSSSINNIGDLDIYPTITVTGPITTPRITNTTTGEYIELNGLVLVATTDILTINYDQDSLSMTVAGISQLDKLTSTSTLFKLIPGINSLTITGSTVGSGMTGTVNARPAWPLS